ncbi:hypothetical protein IG631_06486 [Alternaria alternata]|nr:hypothetical protein IG631_06486 [Alternaria alternata]
MADKLITDTDNEPYCRTKDDAATHMCQTAQEPWVSKLQSSPSQQNPAAFDPVYPVKRFFCMRVHDLSILKAWLWGPPHVFFSPD